MAQAGFIIIHEVGNKESTVVGVGHIIAIEHLTDGRGCVIVTPIGSLRVMETFDEVVALIRRGSSAT